MDDLLSFLPHDIAEIVKAFCALVTACSLLAAAIKRAMGEPKPTDSDFRRAAFRVLHWVDVLASNTEPVRLKMQRMDDDTWRKLAPKTIPPSIPPLHVIAFAFAFALPSSACAGSPLKAHATAADAAADVIDQAGAIIERRARIAEESAVAVSVTREEAAQRVAETRARFAPIEAAYEALRVAHEHYVTEIRIAAKDGRDDVSPDALRAIGVAWAHLAQLAELLSIQLPNPPDDLVSLLGGAS